MSAIQASTQSAELTEYEVRHLIAHLHQAGKTTDLHRLLDLERMFGQPTGPSRQRQENFWYELKDARGDLAGYLADVRRAWQIAEQSRPISGSGTGTIDLEIRYALIIASINSLVTNFTPALLEALVRENIWGPEKALEAAIRILDPKRRADALASLALHLTQPLLREALATGRLIESPVHRASALVRLVRWLPEPLKQGVQEEAIAAVREISDEEIRSETLASVTQHLLATVTKPVARQKLLGVWKTIENEWARVKALRAIGPYLSEPARHAAFRRALSHFREWWPKEAQDLILDLPEKLLKDAIRAIRRIDDQQNRIEALRNLIARFPKVVDSPEFRKELNMILAVEETWTRLELLIMLFPFLSENLKRQTVVEALATGGEESSEWGGTRSYPSWAQRLGDLARELTEPEKGEMLQHALQVAHKLDQGGMSNYRDSALTYLNPILSELSPEQALEEIEEIKSDIGRAKLLVELAPRLMEPARTKALQRALSEARSFELEFKGVYDVLEHLTGIFINVARQLDQPIRNEILRDAAGISEAIHDPWLRAKALTAFSSNVAESRKQHLLQIAIEVAGQTGDPWRRAEVLTEMIPLLSGRSKWVAYRQAVKSARQISDNGHRAQILTELALHSGRRTRQNKLREALAASRDVTFDEERTRIQVQVIPHLSEPLLKEALDVARDKPDYSALEVLMALIPRLPDGLLPDAIAVGHEYREEWVRGVALSAIAARFPDGHLRRQLIEEALQLASSVGFEDLQATVLAAVARQVSGPRRAAVLKKAIRLEMAYLFASQYDENPVVDSKLLISIIPMLGVRLRKHLLLNTFQIPWELVRFEVLTALIPHLPKSSLPQVLAHVKASKYGDVSQARILVALVQLDGKAMANDIWLRAGKISQSYSRALVLTALAPYVSKDKRGKLLKSASNAAREISNYSDRANALTNLVSLMDRREQYGMFAAALEATLRIEEVEALGSALTALASHWETLDSAHIHESWLKCVHALSRRRRPDMLLALPSIAPLIKIISGDVAAEEIAHSIERVGSWWS